MKIIFLIVFTTLNTVVSAYTYYVSPSGNNANTGTISSPFKTITYGESKLKAGDILIVRAGTYNERLSIYGIDGSESNPTIITNYPGETPIIDGTGISIGAGSGLVQINSNYTHFIGFEVKNANITGAYAGGGGVSIAGIGVLVSHCIVHDTWGIAIVIAQQNCIVEYCSVFNTSMSNSDGIRQDGEIWSNGIAIKGGSTTIISNSIIRHNTLHDCWGEGYTLSFTNNCTIEDNIVYDTYSVALYVRNSQNALVQRNLVYMSKAMGQGSQIGIGHWNEGSYLFKNANNTFTNNIVYGCNRNFYSGTPTDGTVGLHVAYNTFVNAPALYNILLNVGSCTNCYFQNNIISQISTIPSIFILPGSNMVFRNNLYDKTYDTDALGTGDLVGDPKLAKTGETGAGKLTADYFKLLSTSPARNRGAVISTIPDDFFSNKRNPTPCIGAIEYFAVDPTIKVSGITVTGAGGVSTIASDNGTLQLIAAITPADATNKTVTWSIANGTGQAVISSSGLVTAIADGTVTARATAKDGSGVFGTLVITISNQVISITKISVTGAGGATMIITGGTLQLNAAILPSNATDKSVTWSIANGTGQAVINSSGLVTGNTNGTVTARAVANDGSGIAGTLIITIANQIIPVTGITVSGAGGISTISLENGTLILIASVLPSDATNNSITWSLENGTGEATISSSGIVTAVANGTVSARATANDGSGISGILEIAISIPSPNTPPFISIISPINGKHFFLPKTIDITSDSYDPDGSISKVEYYIDSKKIGESLIEPYSFSYSFEIADTGTFEIIAVATDNLNTVSFSAPVMVHLAEYHEISDLINLFPNPNDGHFSIHLLSILKDEKNSVTIVDLTGKIVFKGIITNEVNDMQFDIPNINPGTYILLITGKEIVTAKKFIKI